MPCLGRLVGAVRRNDRDTIAAAVVAVLAALVIVERIAARDGTLVALLVVDRLRR
jgi:hypothetical protein